MLVKGRVDKLGFEIQLVVLGWKLKTSGLRPRTNPMPVNELDCTETGVIERVISLRRGDGSLKMKEECQWLRIRQVNRM